MTARLSAKILGSRFEEFNVPSPAAATQRVAEAGELKEGEAQTHASGRAASKLGPAEIAVGHAITFPPPILVHMENSDRDRKV